MLTTPSFLIFGKGCIGSMLAKLLEENGENFKVADARIENREDVLKAIESANPTCVILAAGATGTPNVDWCEDHKQETVRSNIIGCLNVIDVCYLRDIHVTYFASGCVYQYDEEHPEDSDKGFKETDPANFTGSFYSKGKALTEEFVKVYPNVLTLRVKLPVTGDLINAKRDLIRKILLYEKVVNARNSMAILPELLPLAVEMAKNKTTGIVHLTNPGAITYNEIFNMYKEYVDPEYEWENFTVQEQSLILKAPRCSALLDTTKLQSMFPSVLPVKEALIKHVFEPAREKKEEIKIAIRSMRQ